MVELACHAHCRREVCLAKFAEADIDDGFTMNSYSELRTPMIGRISSTHRLCAKGGVSLLCI